jgi:hypothetical protein
MIQYKHIVSKCFSFRIDCLLITDNVHSNVVYNHNHGAIGIVRSNDYQDVLFFFILEIPLLVCHKVGSDKNIYKSLGWSLKSALPLQNTHTPTLTKHEQLYNIPFAWINKQKRKNSQNLATSVLAPALLQVLHRTPLLPTLAGVWASVSISRVSLLTSKFSAAWTPCRAAITSAWKALSKWLA